MIKRARVYRDPYEGKGLELSITTKKGIVYAFEIGAGFSENLLEATIMFEPPFDTHALNTNGVEDRLDTGSYFINFKVGILWLSAHFGFHRSDLNHKTDYSWLPSEMAK